MINQVGQTRLGWQGPTKPLHSFSNQCQMGGGIREVLRMCKVGSAFGEMNVSDDSSKRTFCEWFHMTIISRICVSPSKASLWCIQMTFERLKNSTAEYPDHFGSDSGISSNLDSKNNLEITSRITRKGHAALKPIKPCLLAVDNQWFN